MNNVVIGDLSVQRLAAAECTLFDNQGMVARVIAHYRSGPSAPPP